MVDFVEVFGVVFEGFVVVFRVVLGLFWGFFVGILKEVSKWK